ncbi:unnamed protein product [Ilex paraguariensis]|uniref:rRNA biogenesis protein RRP36 n=1 Tax=Ilex paraguariensis TaxID=185542 RepID=A0ABC8TUH7_9AQUA
METYSRRWYHLSRGEKIVVDMIFTQSGFKKRYNFLCENNLPTEKRYLRKFRKYSELRKLMKKSNDSEAINGLKDQIAWIDKQLKSASTKRTDREILAVHKKERDAAKQGKQPFYLKKCSALSEIRKQKLIEKYNELKVYICIHLESLSPFIEKRRRKNAAKDH